MLNKFNDPKWRNQMLINYDFNCMMAKTIGDKNGICEDEIEILKENIFNIMDDLKSNPKGFMKLPFDTDTSTKIKEYCKKVDGKFENILVLGIGGSALGGITLISALKHYYNNNLSKKDKKSPNIFFYDNVDPDQFHELQQVCDLKKTLTIIITKSGSTVETISAFLIIKENLMNIIGKNYTKNLVIITDSEKGDLRQIASSEKIVSFEIPCDVGGRFSVLSSVGLLPAQLVGIDIDELLAGAKYANQYCLDENVWTNPAAMSATLQYIAYKYKKMNIVVMMPYSAKLSKISDWYKQLWAESLGKKHLKNGELLLTGSTPITALGVTDQHSQLQLFMEGPCDKIINFIRVAEFDNEITIPKIKKSSFEYLGNHTLNELIDIELKSTEYALTKEQRPSAMINLPRINAFTLGQLFYFLEMQVAIAGELFNVNTYDQPGVESGKQYTYGIFNRKGYEDKKKEFFERHIKNKKYVI